MPQKNGLLQLNETAHLGFITKRFDLSQMECCAFLDTAWSTTLAFSFSTKENVLPYAGRFLKFRAIILL